MRYRVPVAVSVISGLLIPVSALTFVPLTLLTSYAVLPTLFILIVSTSLAAETDPTPPAALTASPPAIALIVVRRVAP
jgi:hypothetical protein